MRDERALLWDMVESARQVQAYIAGKTVQQFQTDLMFQDAVVRRIQIIGEAAYQLPQTTRERISAIPWRQIIDMRHVLVHSYSQISMQKIWETATSDLSPLMQALEPFL